ncbi:transcriptional regulator [Burkholderia pseudomallei]|nr:transcriptional regulator [Burkholderia pseudomallei]
MTAAAPARACTAPARHVCARTVAAAQSDGRTAATLGSRKKARALDEPALLLLA